VVTIQATGSGSSTGTTSTFVIANNTQSTSTNSGALQVYGGAGIGGDLYVGGKIVAQELDIQYTTVTTTIIQTDDIIQTSNTTQSTGTSSGALTVAGGVGIGGNLYAGAIYDNGTRVTTSVSAGTDTAVSSSGGTVTVWNTSTLQSVTNRGATTTNVPTFTNGVTIGAAAQITSYTSVATSTNAAMSLDSFAATSYRTAKYVVQVVDAGYTPHLVQVEELLVFHDNNAGSTLPYIVKYGIGTNSGELGDWDAVYSAGNIVLKFTPNYTPTALTVKTARTAITV
jgi:hypothetical protein